jgi:radical SAM superfamily enzyme YgiQ (UPF0313 family)
MVYLISIYENRLFFEDLGISRIAAFLKENGIDCKFSYIKCDDEIDESLWSAIVASDYVGISVYDNNVDYADRIIEKIKNSNPKIITFYGSQYASIAYKDIYKKHSQVDCIVLGDGEYTVLEIIKASQENVPLSEIIENSEYLASYDSQTNKLCRSIEIQELPWPLHHKAYYSKNLHIDLNTSSGCAGNCSFCGSLRRKWTGRTPENIAEHIQATIKETNIHSYYFSDSSFEDPGEYGKKRLSEIADCIKNAGIKCSYSANIRAETFHNNENDINVLSKLKNVGFSQLFVGVESGNDDDLIIYNKRAKVTDNKNTIDLLRKIGIEPFWGFIMFNPYTTSRKLKENYKFLTYIGTYVTYHYISFLTIYNGTNIYGKALKDGLISHIGRNNIQYSYIDPKAKKIHDWIKCNLMKPQLLNIVKQTRDFMHFYYYMNPILPTINKEFDGLIIETQNQLTSINDNFFHMLFEKQDIPDAEKQKDDFSNSLQRIWSYLSKLQINILRQYYSAYPKLER